MKILRHKFVEYIPEDLEEGILYITIEYCTAIHKCVCGCNNEVVTPISPTGWQFSYNGETVTLYPSIGNWNFECKSHYWITKNEINFVSKYSELEITKVKKEGHALIKKYFRKKKRKNK